MGLEALTPTPAIAMLTALTAVMRPTMTQP